MAPIERKASAPKIPPVHNWRTTDDDEIERRRLRARSGHFAISNLDAKHPIFSNFRIRSGSGLTYSIEIRSIREWQFACSCVDFRINGLGTCKHAEAVLLHLEARYKKLFKAAGENGSYRIDVVPDHAADTLRLARGLMDLTGPLRRLFDERGVLRDGSPEEANSRLSKAGIPALRISQDVEPYPARLEQRIARAWRKYQSRPVTVINLVSQDTIEERMLGTLANKQAKPLPSACASGSLARSSAARSNTRSRAATRCSWSWSIAIPSNGASSSRACTGSSLLTAPPRPRRREPPGAP